MRQGLIIHQAHHSPGSERAHCTRTFPIATACHCTHRQAFLKQAPDYPVTLDAQSTPTQCHHVHQLRSKRT